MQPKLRHFALLLAAASPLQANAAPPHADPNYSNRYTAQQLAPVLQPGRIYYAAPGLPINPSANGTKAAPYTSLLAVRNAIRELKATTGLPNGGVHVVVLAGDYAVDQPLELGPQDSGTAAAPIVYRAQAQGSVTLSCGEALDLTRLATVSNTETLSRFKPSARGKIMAIDVPKNLRPNFPATGKYGMLSLDGHLLTLAQWPNRGYHHIDKILDEGPVTRWLGPGEKPPTFSKDNPIGGSFTTKESLHPRIEAEFKHSGDIQVQGYLHNDWYFQTEPLGAIDGGVIKLLGHTRYGIKNKIKSLPRRVRLVNVLAELDEPGEWYYDRISHKLYLWPTPGFVQSKARLTVLPSAADKPSGALFQLKNTQYITLRDLTLQNTGNLAIQISGGKHNLVAGCTLRNGVGRGVSINGGTHNGITGCSFHDLHSALSVSGGNLSKLERSYNFVTNNDIHSCRLRGYGVVGLRGVGLYFAHNRLHDMNGAVHFRTVDTLLEYNEFYNIGYEMGDFNVAYCGAVWYTMNNVLRFNFVHHLLEPGGHPIAAFRNDDGGQGLHMYGNVFYRCGRAGAQFHGPNNSLENNITLDSTHVWWTNKRPGTPDEIAAAWKDLERFGRDLPHGDKGDNLYIMEKLLGQDGWKKSPWIDEFPQLAAAIDINPFAQTYSRVAHNYAYKVRKPFHIHGRGGSVDDLEDPREAHRRHLPIDGPFDLPMEITLDAFVDLPALNLAFRDDFVPMEGFTPIPFEKIGLVQDAFRPTPPDKATYRSNVYQRMLNDTGGRYDAEKVNARYPTPSYLR